MKTTTPPPLAAVPGDRSEYGLFAAADVDSVVANLRDDLLAFRVSPESLSLAFNSGAALYLEDDAADDERVASARKESTAIFERLLDGRMTSGELPLLVRAMYFAGYQRLLAKHHLRFPAYNILDEYFTNVTSPNFAAVLPRPVVAGKTWTLFGQAIGLPIGVPASVLTGNARWIQALASNGFNVLTYKTVRSRAHQPSQSPNWAFVPDEREAWPISDEHRQVFADPWDWVDPGQRDVTTANSFGVPSPEPREWRADIENALNAIASDQLMLVSVMGDDYDGVGKASVIADDFAGTALMAEQAGAKVIELNLSCPNSLDLSGGVKPPVCFDAELTQQIVETVREKLDGATRLVAKLSYLNEDRLASLVHRIAPLVDGFSGINTLQTTVLRTGSSSTFPGRDLAGVSGIAVRTYALDFIARLNRLRVETGKYFEILGMGGVTDPESFAMQYHLGANAVQTASGTFANPFLAAECAETVGSELPTTADFADLELRDLLRLTVSEFVRDAEKSVRVPEVVSALPLRANQAAQLIGDMVEAGDLKMVDGLLYAH